MPEPSLRPHHPRARILSEMCAEFGLEPHTDDFDTEQIEVTGVVSDADRVESGDMFVADIAAGHNPTSQFELAVERGASSIMTNALGAEHVQGDTVPVLVVEDPRLALGHIARWVYRTDPDSPKLLGVTGSRGKTSVVYLIDYLLQTLGVKTGMSTNQERHVGDERLDARGVAADADELHAMLARMHEVGVHVASAELSTQAVIRHNFAGLYFDVAGFLNFEATAERPGSPDSSFEALVELFSPEQTRRGVINIDTEDGQRLLEETRVPVSTISIREDAGADWWVCAEPTETGTQFSMYGPDDRELHTWTSQEDPHSAINAAMAILMIDGAGWDVEQMQDALGRVDGIQLEPRSRETLDAEARGRMRQDDNL
ncbi:Mur ligase family protein [Gulosibacter chungangensis]|uniref:Mur ligase central domain-containing protein n=1 Tax=Gulosibacter chungangensis TaxID=979746 RepID=A0A7J5BCN8_9MICO|nr:Mur ligase family protein [Gulosibacter chungangensis]KAB1643978.1 hypothetical protein F8O05_04035 [Gulosibacter chungangensis]